MTGVASIVLSALVLGVATSVGVAAAAVGASTRTLSAVTGATVGVVGATAVCVLLPAAADGLRGGLVGPILAGLLGLASAAAVHRAVLDRLPPGHAVEDEEAATFLLGIVTDDLAEGVALGMAATVSGQLLALAAAPLAAKCLLTGFTEGTILRWTGASVPRLVAASVASAAGVLIASLAGFGVGSVLPAAGRFLLLSAATGALLYASAFELARNLEWNVLQRATAAGAFVVTTLALLAAGGTG